MAGSWRDILDSASTSFPMGRGRARPDPAQYRPAPPERGRRSSGQSYSGAEARDLLERELRAISAQPLEDLPALADRGQAVPPRRPPDPRPMMEQRVPVDK